jgi:hypothetical protein
MCHFCLHSLWLLYDCGVIGWLPAGPVESITYVRTFALLITPLSHTHTYIYIYACMYVDPLLGNDREISNFQTAVAK